MPPYELPRRKWELIDYLIIAFITIMVIVFPIMIYQGYEESLTPYYTIYKNEWTCTHTERIGKIDQCVEYSYNDQ